MEAKELLRVLHTAERLKDETRHCYTSGGRHESVAEHSWRLALTALFLRDEFPALDIDRVIRMCLIHDLGECFTGDIPSFLKSGGDEERERSALETWVASLPAPYSVELKKLYAEMDALETDEARLYKALDKLEAVIQHNESDIATWLPREYELASLTAVNGVDKDSYLAIGEKQVYIGRLDKNDFILMDPNASRMHAYVTYERHRHFLHDAESTNGTFVNGKPVLHACLAPGDEIQIGSTVLLYEVI